MRDTQPPPGADHPGNEPDNVSTYTLNAAINTFCALNIAASQATITLGTTVVTLVAS